MKYIYGTPIRKGPESNMVKKFLSSNKIPLPLDLNYSIFVELSLENSRPDIIILYWDPRVMVHWPKERLLLKDIDYKLIHFLFIKGEQTYRSLLHYFPHGLNRILSRLTLSNIVFQTENNWRLVELDNIFAIKKIITIEAKTSASSRVFQQAMLNTLFASESYVLTSVKCPKENAFYTANKLGVGLWTFSEENITKLVSAKSQPLPQSYISWKLNDLVWQMIRG